MERPERTLRALLVNEPDLASDTPVEVLVGHRRYPLVGAQAELNDDNRAVTTLVTALRARCGRRWRMSPMYGRGNFRPRRHLVVEA